METMINSLNSLSLNDEPTQQPQTKVWKSSSARVQSPPSVLPVSKINQSALTSTKFASKRKRSVVKHERRHKRNFYLAKKKRHICKNRALLKKSIKAKCFASDMETIINGLKALSLNDEPTQQPVSTNQVCKSSSAGVQSPRSVLPVSKIDQSALTSTNFASKRKRSVVDDEHHHKRSFSFYRPEKTRNTNGDDRVLAVTASTSRGASSIFHNRGSRSKARQEKKQSKEQHICKKRALLKRPIKTKCSSSDMETIINGRKAWSLNDKPTQQEQHGVPKKVPKIWIIGSSYIKRGEWAARQMFGENFGLDANVHWFGRGGMRWNGVLPRFYAEISKQSPPDILVIHAGGNDLGLISAQELSSVMKKELIELHAKFPSMTILYSCINERQVWQYGNPKYINKDRKTVNSVMRKAVNSFGGVIIEHPFLKYYDDTIFIVDGIHFSRKGNDMFLTSIHCAIEKILQNSSHRKQT